MKNDVINNHWREMVLGDDWLHTSTDISTLMFCFPIFQKTSDHKKTTPYIPKISYKKAIF